MISLRPAVQDRIRALPGVSLLASLERCTPIFSQSQPAEIVYLIQDGLLKLTRSNGARGRVILSICGPGQLIGEEALCAENRYYTEAMTINTASVHRIPREVLLNALMSDGELSKELIDYILGRKSILAEKVELLCLHDVEYRILHYLAQLATLLPAIANGDGFQIPITQLELADLIGATRETTSTTLNQLERRGLLKLSRRLLTVPSPDNLRSAAAARVSASPAHSSQGSSISSGS